MIGGNQELFDEQEKEYLLLAEKQVKLLEVINSDSHLLETSALNKTTENLTEEVKINSRMIEKQNRTFIEVETSLDEVEEESESMSEEYNYNLEELVEVQKEHNQTFNEHKQKVEKVVNEMNALNNSVQQELDSQKAEYSELFGQQEENLKNRSKNTEKEQESSKDKLLEKVEEQKNTIDSLNEKQSSLEASLNETQEDIDSQSQQINDLNNSVDDIEDGNFVLNSCKCSEIFGHFGKYLSQKTMAFNMGLVRISIIFYFPNNGYIRILCL